MTKKMIDLLLKSFDTDLTIEEQQRLDDALKASPELRIQKQELIRMRDLMGNSDFRFRPHFSDRVMAGIRDLKKKRSEMDPFFESLVLAFRPLAISALLFILGFMSYNALHNHQPFIAGLIPSQETSLEQAFDPAWTYFQE